ncbi:single-stranded DNA-binding protein [uncultured Micrococcus sp.]|uniref:single-stranded DNA-binding protein n=1 Tax=uncultured Micrococcus sp. TaxID=114051 RepID=UPI0025965CAB|nr:single-stranded DNA-binding protein [uncultured Micrococcus sp.]
MQDTITLRGRVATDLSSRKTANGTTVVGFRLACTERRYDRATGQWSDAHTNWYSVSAFGRLGSHASQSLAKGNPVLVTGRLRIRDWATGERSGTSVDVVADSLGHDLNHGVASYIKAPRGVQQEWGERVETGQLRRLVDGEEPCSEAEAEAEAGADADVHHEVTETAEADTESEVRVEDREAEPVPA